MTKNEAHNAIVRILEQIEDQTFSHVNITVDGDQIHTTFSSGEIACPHGGYDNSWLHRSSQSK